jgi:hypothetical protein
MGRFQIQVSHVEPLARHLEMSRTARIDATGQCILGRIGEAKRLFERAGLQDGEDRSEDFFLCDPSRGSDIGKDRRPDIPARLCDTASTITSRPPRFPILM